MSPSSRTSSARRSGWRRADIALLVLAVIGLGLGTAARAAEGLGHSLSPLAEPLPAPAFTLEDMDGEAHSLADYRGQVVLLNFWATWCPPCRKEMPSMERLYQAMADEPFTVVAINQFESPDHVFAYTGQLAVDPTFTILFDRDSSVAKDYGVLGLPSTYLIDAQGRIRYKAIGGREFDHPEVEAQIRGLIAEGARAAVTD